MREQRYQLKFSAASTMYEFISEGPKGRIPKLIKYTYTNSSDVYNLGFGDKIGDTDDFDDVAISNNDDSIRILATVAASVYVFTSKYPNVFIYATGSTLSRTRLYRMGISNNLDEIEEDFLVWGQFNDQWEVFQKNRNYTAFLVTRK